MDPNAQHDSPAEDAPVRVVRRGTPELCGPPGAHSPAESTTLPAGADGVQADAVGAELAGGVPPGGAERSSGAVEGWRGPASVPVLQEQEERGAGEGAPARASPRGGRASAGGQAGGRRGKREEGAQPEA